MHFGVYLGGIEDVQPGAVLAEMVGSRDFVDVLAVGRPYTAPDRTARPLADWLALKETGDRPDVALRERLAAAQRAGSTACATPSQ